MITLIRGAADRICYLLIAFNRITEMAIRKAGKTPQPNARNVSRVLSSEE